MEKAQNSSSHQQRHGRDSIKEGAVNSPRVMTRSQLKRLSLSQTSNLPYEDDEETEEQTTVKRSNVKTPNKKSRVLSSDLSRTDDEKFHMSRVSRSNKRLHTLQENEKTYRQLGEDSENAELSHVEETGREIGSSKNYRNKTKKTKEVVDEYEEVEKAPKKKSRNSLKQNNEVVEESLNLSECKSNRSSRKMKQESTPKQNSKENRSKRQLSPSTALPKDDMDVDINEKQISDHTLESEDVSNINDKKKRPKKFKHQRSENSDQKVNSFSEKDVDCESLNSEEKSSRSVAPSVLESLPNEISQPDMLPAEESASKSKIKSKKKSLNDSFPANLIEDKTKSGNTVLRSEYETPGSTHEDNAEVTGENSVPSKEVSFKEVCSKNINSSAINFTKGKTKSKVKSRNGSSEICESVKSKIELEKEFDPECEGNISTNEVMCNTTKSMKPSKEITSNEEKLPDNFSATKKCASSSVKLVKENISHLSKHDQAKEYNRSITEEISLLKPKTFAVRRSLAMFRQLIGARGDGSGQEADSDAECRKAIMESAQKRIEQNLSTSESDSRLFRGVRIPMPHSSKNDSSDSDSVPEITFETGKKQYLESAKDAADHIKKQKQKKKERRKARLEMLKQQKEEKLIRLKEKMASQEDASCSSSEESGYEEEVRNARQKMRKKKAKSKSQSTEKENLDDGSVPGTQKAYSGAESDDSSEKEVPMKASVPVGVKRLPSDTFEYPHEPVPSKIAKVGVSNGQIQDEASKKKKNKTEKFEEKDKDKERDFKNLTSLDYIPLKVEGSTNFMVVPLDRSMNASKSITEKAMEFRQNMLFGSRIRREPGKINTAYQQKLKAAGNDRHVR